VIISDLIGTGILLAYYLIVCVLIPTAFKAWLGIPTELVRKSQHVAYSLSIFILLKLFSSWYVATGAAFILVLVAYPALILIERTRIYRKWFVDRENRGGELRKQLLFVQLTFAVLLFIYWGLLGTRWHYVIAVAVMAWGFGDAAAALIGKAFGKRRVIHKWIEGAKTYEGTIAMILVSGAALFLTLFLYAGKPWYVSLIAAIIVAPVSGVVELFSRRGMDTLWVPLAAAGLIMPLMYLFSFFGL
jgi:phytol kinase